MNCVTGFVARVGGGTLCDKRRRQMKTLINKANPQIRITAPEIKEWSNKYYYIKDIKWVIMQENWALIEEEPVDKNTNK